MLRVTAETIEKSGIACCYTSDRLRLILGDGRSGLDLIDQVGRGFDGTLFTASDCEHLLVICAAPETLTKFVYRVTCRLLRTYALGCGEHSVDAWAEAWLECNKSPTLNDCISAMQTVCLGPGGFTLYEMFLQEDRVAPLADFKAVLEEEEYNG